MKRLIKILRLLNAPCEEMVRLVSQSLDCDLPWDERLAMRSHLLYCRACCRFRRQMVVLRDLVERYADAPLPGSEAGAFALSADARERMKHALTAES